MSSSSAPAGPGPLVILVRPQMGENIGAAARAMLNFGLTGMRLVAPRDGWPNPKAKAMASGAASVIDGVRIFDTVEEAIADCHLVLATTARQRGVFLPTYEPVEAVQHLRAAASTEKRTAVLFGAEKSGLETEVLAHADAILTIPVNPGFSSLNLAQAVIILAYEWAKAEDLPPLFQSPYAEETAPHGMVDGLVRHMETALDQAGYFYPVSKRTTLSRNIRTLLTNAKFTEAEVRLFRGMIRQFERKLPGGMASSQPHDDTA